MEVWRNTARSVEKERDYTTIVNRAINWEHGDKERTNTEEDARGSGKHQTEGDGEEGVDMKINLE